MDTVVGLSLTSTSVGWVLVDGRDADGTILDHEDFEVGSGGALCVVNTSEQATGAVLDAQAAAASYDRRLHTIGLTWSDEAAAEAALLLESLTSAGFHNVVPIRLHDACDLLARAIAPVVGYDRAAVCVLDGDSTVVAMVDMCDDEPQTAIKHLTGGPGRLVQWLTGLFDRSSWQPGGIVVVGPDEDLEALAWRLEKAVPVPVITQTGAQLALARGAALASADSTEFTDNEMVEAIDIEPGERGGSRQSSYAGALTMLVAGAVTFVASASLAVGPHLLPDRGAPVHHVTHRAAAPPVVEAPAPQPAAVETPIARPAPPPTPTKTAAAQPQTVVSEQPPAELPAAQPVPPPAPPPPPVAPPPPNPHPLLTKLLERLHGQNPPPDQPAPPQGPPPNPGAPPPP